MGGERIQYIPYIKILGGIVCGAYLLFSGTQMIYKDINSTGTTTLKLFGNELSATSLGIAVIFIGAVLLICTIRWPVSKSSKIDTIDQPSEVSRYFPQNEGQKKNTILTPPPHKPPDQLRKSTIVRHEENYIHYRKQPGRPPR